LINKKCSKVLIVILGLFLQSCDDELPPIIEINQSDYGRLKNEYIIADCSNQIDFLCVASSESFLEAINSNVSTIVLEDGDYDLGKVTINRTITIKSQHLWGAVVTGSTYLKISANHVIIQGVKFVDGASSTEDDSIKTRHGVALVNSSTNVNFRDDYFQNIGVNSTVDDGTGIGISIIDSSEVYIENNVFNNSRAIAFKTDNSSKNVIVKNNEFTNSFNFGGAGEVAHFGTAYSVSQGTPPIPDDSFHEFSNNYVSNWNLEKELISIKSSKNKVFNNLFVDNGDSAIVVRMGNDNEIYNNVMLGNQEYPVRISGERNIIRDNSFCGVGVTLSLHAQMVFSEYRDNLYNSYWAAIDNEIVDNNFYGYSGVSFVDLGSAAQSDFFAGNPENNLILNNNWYYQGVFSELSIGTILQNNVSKKNIECPFKIIE